MATAKKKKPTKKAPVKKTVAKKPAAKKAAPQKAAAKKSSAPAPKASKIDWQKLIQPLQDRMVALEIETSNTTESGLILVSPEKESFVRARVVAAGLGRISKKGKLRPLDVQVGDVILVTSYAGTKVTVENQEAIIVREDDVLGIVSSPSL